MAKIDHLMIQSLIVWGNTKLALTGHPQQHVRLEFEVDAFNRTHCHMFAEPESGPADLHPFETVMVTQ